jgi:ribosomal protein S18 acetylase RimI-like enzyme
MTPLRPTSHHEVSLRDATKADDEVLFSLFAVSRADLLVAIAGLDDQQRESLMRLQFQAQQAQYRGHYPNARQDLVVMHGDIIGQIQIAVLDDELRLVDLSLLPEYRNRGFGGALLRDLLEEAADANKRVILHVSQGNPAARLYERYGFSHAGDQGIYWRMEWVPSCTASTG